MTTKAGPQLTATDLNGFYDSLSFAWGVPDAEAVFKASVDDFEVDEILGWTCTGDGEHLCVLVRKTGMNTVDVARHLARCAHIPVNQVGFAGMKDRQGVCRQWFSLHLPGRSSPALDNLSQGNLVIEDIQRNSRKIRRGAHAANRFRIRLREVSDPGGSLETRLQRIASQGVPNYFGEQRFGRQENNIRQAMAWFEGRYRPRGRQERGLLLSTARSVIFNAVLSRRVASGTWQRYLAGDVMNLSGTSSFFCTASVSHEAPGGHSSTSEQETDRVMSERLASGDIHPTGPLWGRGELQVTSDARTLEQSVANEFAVLAEGLCREGASQARRSLRLLPEQLHYARSPGELHLSFTLPSGAYATAVLRELCRYRTPQLSENDIS